MCQERPPSAPGACKVTCQRLEQPSMTTVGVTCRSGSSLLWHCRQCSFSLLALWAARGSWCRLSNHCMLPASAALKRSVASMVTVKMECDRELSWFIIVAPTTRFFLPTCHTPQEASTRLVKQAEAVTATVYSQLASDHTPAGGHGTFWTEVPAQFWLPYLPALRNCCSGCIVEVWLTKHTSCSWGDPAD